MQFLGLFIGIFGLALSMTMILIIVHDIQNTVDKIYSKISSSEEEEEEEED